MRTSIMTGFVVLSVLGTAQADTLNYIGAALDYAGFDARGSRNPLSGGADLLVTRQFNGNVFDFGNTEVLLQGPVSLQVAAGGRIIPSIDLSFRTAFNARSQQSTLSYNYLTDIGPQSTSINGSMQIDAGFYVNALGFYDITLTSSNRSTITREGVVSDTETRDSDVGPVSISGNVFVDLLGVLVDPIFEQSGRENPFATMSKLIQTDLQGHPLLWSTAEQRDANFVSLARHAAMSTPGLTGREAATGAVVPEPTVLAMLLLGIPVVLHRLRRVRFA